MRKNQNFIFCAVLLTLISCSEELKYSKEDLLVMAMKAEPSVKVVLPRSITEGVSCADYPAGCKSAHIVELKGLTFIGLEFETELEAIATAKKIRGYYTRNWAWDDVSGEPMLEKFVQSALEAKKP